MPVSEDKREYAKKLHGFIEKYNSAFIVFCDNVGSKQMQDIRLVLREGKGKASADILMGKNVSCCLCVRVGRQPQSRRGGGLPD